MNYTQPMRLPAVCTALTENEQVYIDGGGSVSSGIQTALSFGAAAVAVGLLAAAVDGFLGLCFAAYFGEKTTDFLQSKAGEAANLAVSKLDDCLDKARLTS